MDPPTRYRAIALFQSEDVKARRGGLGGRSVDVLTKVVRDKTRNPGCNARNVSGSIIRRGR